MLYYEGLVCATARRCVAFCEEDFEDVAQLLRVKVWQALCAYDPQKSRTTRDKYVFMCVRDRAKDVVKKKMRYEQHIEDHRDKSLRAEHFDERYLCSTREENFGAIENDVDPLAGLDELERTIVNMLTDDYKQTHIARELGLPKVEVERAMKSIRAKLAHLRPEDDQPAAVVDEVHARRRHTTTKKRPSAEEPRSAFRDRALAA